MYVKYSSKIDEIIRKEIGVFYPNLTEKELEVIRKVTTTMWDFHWDVADYNEIVLRALDNPIFASSSDVHKVIGSLVTKGILEDKEIEFLYGIGESQSVRLGRVLTLVRKELYDKMRTAMLKTDYYS